MQTIEALIATLSGWVWGPPMLTLLVGTGLYLTVLLKGLQFRVLPLAFRLVFHKDHGHAGDISHFAALMTALAATVASATSSGSPPRSRWVAPARCSGCG
jgi:AGCS family alanine or glycine:cation symporter